MLAHYYLAYKVFAKNTLARGDASFTQFIEWCNIFLFRLHVTIILGANKDAPSCRGNWNIGLLGCLWDILSITEKHVLVDVYT